MHDRRQTKMVMDRIIIHDRHYEHKDAECINRIIIVWPGLTTSKINNDIVKIEFTENSCCPPPKMRLINNNAYFNPP